MNLNNEATLQGEFYHACRLRGIPCFLEVSTPAGRLDAIITNKGHSHLLAIVEFKQRAGQFMDGNSAQMLRYRAIGVPVHALAIGADAHAYSERIWGDVKDSQGISLGTLSSSPALLAIRRDRKQGRQERRLERFRENLNVK